jgi:hypothetical protein
MLCLLSNRKILYRLLTEPDVESYAEGGESIPPKHI